MAQIKPFSGIRFNTEKKNSLAELISPPYDKITSEEREALWERDEHNVVKLILPPPSDNEIDTMTQSTDTISQDWYREAAQLWRMWRRDNVLVEDPPCFYVYQQTYTYKGETWTRTGLFGALQLEEQGGPHSHEHTFEGPKADRLRLIRETQANLSPIFLFGDGEVDAWNEIFSQATEELFRFRDEEEQEHALLAINDDTAVKKASKFMEQCTLVIADGHHRHETAKNYCREMRDKTGKDPQKEPWGSQMVFIVPSKSPGLLVLPTHRVVSGLPNDWVNKVTEKCLDFFTIESLPERSGAMVRKQLQATTNQQGIVVVGKEQGWVLSPKKDVEIPPLKEVHPALRGLNVTLLHQLLFEHCLQLDKETMHSNTKYIREEEEAIELVNTGDYDAAFLLAGIPPQTVFDVSLHGVRMPQKSTDFYPKIPTGLVMRSVADSSQE